MKNLIKTLFAITLCLPLTLSAQQWSGTANTTSAISRTGQVTIDNTTTVRRLHIKTNTVTNNPDISLSAQAMIETESNMFLNIDSDNDTENAHFTVGKNSPTTTGYTPLFRIRESGNVGVGRTNPLQKLDVAGNIKLGAGADAFLQNTTGYIGVRPADGMHGFIIRDYTGQSTHWSGLRHVDNGNADRLEFSVMNNDYGKSLVVTQNKRVGIGTENPEYKLHVTEAARINKVNIGGNPDGSGFHDGITGHWSLQLNAAKSGGAGGDIVMRSEGAAKMIVKSNGNVGVGTTNPTQKLHVEGNFFLPDGNMGETGNMYLGGKTDDGEKGMRLVGGGINNGAINGGIIDVNTSTPGEGLLFRVDQNNGGTERMRLNAKGQLLINTTMPTLDNVYKLGVNGKIICEGMRVKLKAEWADYVFDEDYDLMSLEEVETHIQENKHLPGVPSAKEVAETGLDIEIMQVKMMEKIEELTLYIIEQDKQIKTQQTQINELMKDK